MQTNPTPYITAKPLETNILEWHYVLRGPPDTPYEGGEYHGRVKFPSEYPFKPPAIQMITPSGRFQTNTNICMSMSNFHPNTWNPAWSVATILNGLLSFMVEDEATTGGIRATDHDRKILARKSHSFNLNNKTFASVFSELCTAKPEPIEDPTKPGEMNNQEDDTVAVSVVGARKRTKAKTAEAENNSNDRATAMPLAAIRSKKWIIVLVVLAYFFLSKAVSRILTV